MKINKDCKYFKGYKPCIYNKKYGTECKDCEFYKPISCHILIIKLAGIGDVIRTTPILRRLRSLYPDAKIHWLTEYPEVLPDEVNKIKFDFRGIEIVKSINLDKVYNLDKSSEACALTNKINCIELKGFQLDNMYGVIKPVDSCANHKYLTGIFDDVSKKNKKHYVEEIFEICDIGKFEGEEYLLPEVIPVECLSHPNSMDSFEEGKKIIGVNTGCGDRWESRIWDIRNWIKLSKELTKNGYEVVLLGGEKEHILNGHIALHTNIKYYGTFPINEFVSIVNLCDLVVSQITSAAHIAIGLKKKVVLMNNIFNKNEFYLYNRGKIIEPKIECNCYYAESCNCMDYITVEEVIQAIEGII